MLKLISSNILRDGSIGFEPGLNVIQGDLNATNSIGKSSLLMMIDFAFGGTSLIEHNKDIISELGHHDYDIMFKFNNVEHQFRRSTLNSETVASLTSDGELIRTYTISEYTNWLKESYELVSEDITFRALVSLFSRIWGRQNLDVKRPLHISPKQNASDCIDNLIKIFGKYGPIKDLRTSLKGADEKKKAISRAFKNEIIPKISASQYKDNQTRVSSCENELEDIKGNLQQYSISIREIVNREMTDLKDEKDALLSVKGKLSNQLKRIEDNLEHNRSITGRYFEATKEYFPNIDNERLNKVEAFHRGLSSALKSELLISKSELEIQLVEINEEIEEINSKISLLLKSHENPAPIVDRVFELSTKIQDAKKENKYYDENKASTGNYKTIREELGSIKDGIAAEIQYQVNNRIDEIMHICFSDSKKSPHIGLGESNYNYEVFEDTGTGTAYASMIVLDLAVFSLTNVPYIAHDSLLFKNIENNSVSELINIYVNVDKQSFIALDEIIKYGEETARLLDSKSCVRLSDDHVLTTKDWRQKNAQH